MTASASYLSPSARLASPSSRSSSSKSSSASSTAHLSPHARPPPAPLLSILTSHLLVTLDICSQLLYALSSTCLPYLHHRLTALLSRLTSSNIGYLLWSIVLAALPVPLSGGVEYAVPLPFAGSTNVEERELSRVDYAMTLYTPLALRRRRKHTLVLDLDEVHHKAHISIVSLLVDQLAYRALLRSLSTYASPLCLLSPQTLVHTTDVEIPVSDCRVNIHTRRLSRTFYILKRPHLDTFLLSLAPYYSITVFTASIRRYADAVIDLIDTHSSISQRLYRTHCVRDDQGQLIKDLAAVGKGRKRVVIVDNSPFAYSRNEDNAIPISTWYDEQSDTELRSLIPLLLALRNVDDVRTVLGRRRMMMQS